MSSKDAEQHVASPGAALPLVFLATVVGLLVRLPLPLSSAFPLNDGGLFFAMMSDLQRSEFALPAVTSYNQASIPFAYPPLAIYVTAITSTLSGIELLDLMRLLPPIISLLAVLACFRLARSLLPEPMLPGLAAFLFALVPRAFEWHIMGGGITRAPGLLFGILALSAFADATRNPGWRRAASAGVLSALTVLTHPEAALQLALGAICLQAALDRSRRGLSFFVASIATAALLSSPWWATVLFRHGASGLLAPAMAAYQDSPNAFARLFSLFRFEFTGEPYLPLVAVFALVGLFVRSPAPAALLGAWAALAYLVEPRSGTLFMMLPTVMLAAIGLSRLLGMLVDAASAPNVLAEPRSRALFLTVMVYLLLAAFVKPFRIAQDLTLEQAELESMHWITDSTPGSAQFVLITRGEPLLDPVSDWFPALTDRVSLGTVFGFEWVGDGRFGQRVSAYAELQACGLGRHECLEQWSAVQGLEFTHVYLTLDEETRPLESSLATSSEYKLVFHNAAAAVFAREQD